MVLVLELAMLIVIGFAVSLSFWYFATAVRAPAILGFDRHTLNELGLLYSVVVYALTGPVLVLDESCGRSRHPAFHVIAALTSLIWAASVGIVITGLLQPAFV